MGAVRTISIDSTDDGPVCLHDHGGSSHGPHFLLAHATGFHGRVFDPLAEALASRGHVWSWDFRGHGHSPASDDEADWHYFAIDVLAVVDHVRQHESATQHGDGPRPLVGIGHSMGGAALVLAELARPGTFAGLFVYEPIIFPGEAMARIEGNPLAAGARRRRARFASKQEALTNYRSKPPLSGLDPRCLAAYVDHGLVEADDGDGVQLCCRPEFESRTFEMSAGHNAFARLGELHCPLLVASSGDDGVPARLAPEIARIVPQAQHVEYRDLDHFGPLVVPERIATDIGVWLRERVTAGA
ncbi:MAG: alpha/beta fold hydrolase [Acidimicrobiia bacterium]